MVEHSPSVCEIHRNIHNPSITIIMCAGSRSFSKMIKKFFMLLATLRTSIRHLYLSNSVSSAVTKHTLNFQYFTSIPPQHLPSSLQKCIVGENCLKMSALGFLGTVA